MKKPHFSALSIRHFEIGFACGMNMKRMASLLALLLLPPVGLSQTSVTTYHYDNARTGQNTQEKFLSPANVIPNQFRKLFSQPVDGDVYAQPLYVPSLSIPGKGIHNVVFVATQGDTVYAFDADDPQGANAAPLWKAPMACTITDQTCTQYGAPASATTVPATDAQWCGNIYPQIGITGTPAIDATTGTLYVVTKTKENNAYVQRLHALDIATGMEKLGGHTEIKASVSGNGDGSSNGTLAFDPLRENQRPALLLQNGTVYIAWASHCDTTPFHGWIMAYDARTLAQVAALSITPNGSDGGIWMVGDGPAADADGSLFLSTGNGDFDPTKGDFGDSILKLDPRLNLVDYFTPFNQKCMSGIPDENNCPAAYAASSDVDLGSGGVLLLPDQPGPHPHLLVQSGKPGTIYLVDRDQMTAGNQHFCSACFPNGPDTNIAQELPNAVGSMGVAAYWNSNVYFRGSTFALTNVWDGALRAFSLSNGTLSTSPRVSSDPPFGANITVSANSDRNGIVWGLNNSALAQTQNVPVGPGILKAYDAIDLSLLYSSDWNPNRDNPGGAGRFTSPIVANGKVYVGTMGTPGAQLSVFGLFGIGGYDLGSSADQSFAFDYDRSGKADHLALYRPGTGSIWILKNNAGNFTPLYQQSDPGSGIGGYDLKSPADRMFALDYDRGGRVDHLVLYRPGTGTIWILKNSAGTFTPVYQGSSGIGGFDLQSPADQAFAFDYDASGKLDHLVLYRSGSSTIWILKNEAGTFTPVYQGLNGIGGYDLKSAADRVFAFDYDGSGKLDHLVLYRPGSGTIAILKNSAGTFTPVYQGNSGIGGYDLKSAADRVMAFDYDGSGKLDHLALYRPGTDTIWIAKNNAGSFTPVYQGGGIGGYKLSSVADQAFALDYDGSGRLDHLVLYRPGTSTIFILQNNAGMFDPSFAAWEHTP